MTEEARERLPRFVVEAIERTERFAPMLIGKAEASARSEAEAAGCTIRVVCRDGESFVITMDLRPSRINVTIDGGVVTAVEVG